jgi:hypothetical protein
LQSARLSVRQFRSLTQKKNIHHASGCSCSLHGIPCGLRGTTSRLFQTRRSERRGSLRSGGPQATQIVAANQADASLATVEPVINGYDKGIRGKIFARTNAELIYYIAVPEDLQ